MLPEHQHTEGQNRILRRTLLPQRNLCCREYDSVFCAVPHVALTSSSARVPPLFLHAKTELRRAGGAIGPAEMPCGRYHWPAPAPALPVSRGRNTTRCVNLPGFALVAPILGRAQVSCRGGCHREKPAKAWRRRDAPDALLAQSLLRADLRERRSTRRRVRF
jgi:hypothetical protein